MVVWEGIASPLVYDSARRLTGGVLLRPTEIQT